MASIWGGENAGGDVPEGVPVEEIPSSSKDGERVVFIDTREKIPREFYIGQKDVSKHGTTRGCGGCSSMVRGFPRQPHNASCRERFREAMRDDAKVIVAENRKREFEESEKARKARRDERKEETRDKRKRQEEGLDTEDAKGGPLGVPPMAQGGNEARKRWGG